MVLDNLAVCHKKFGPGVVIATNGNYMTIKFQDVEKVFVYPDAFETFLTLANGALNEEIENDIKLAKEEKQRILNKKNEENLRAMTRGIVIPGKEFNMNEGDEEEGRFKSTESEEL